MKDSQRVQQPIRAGPAKQCVVCAFQRVWVGESCKIVIFHTLESQLGLSASICSGRSEGCCYQEACGCQGPSGDWPGWFHSKQVLIQISTRSISSWLTQIEMRNQMIISYVYALQRYRCGDPSPQHSCISGRRCCCQCSCSCCYYQQHWRWSF